MDDKKPEAMNNQRKTLFCYGYGYVAENLARTLKSTDDDWKIIGTTTDVEKLALMRESGIKSFLFSDKVICYLTIEFDIKPSNNPPNLCAKNRIIA